jgi:hypothetical protein
MKTVFVFSVLFFLSGIVKSQTEYFNERYPVEGHWGNANSGIVVMDTAYFISPNNLKSPSPFRKNLIMQLDLKGEDTTITSFIGYDSIDAINTGVIKRKNNKMVIAWSMYDLDSFNYALVFYDNLGIEEQLVIDSKKFAYLFITDLQETHDHGFILTGIVRYLPDDQGGSQDVVLIRTDSLGNELWFKTLGGNGQQQGYSVAVCDDGGFIVAALDGKEVWIIRTDSMGTMLWERFYGSTVWGNAGPQRILQTRDGGYVFASGWGTEEFGINDWIYRPWIQKIDANGDTLWAWFSVDQDTAAFSDYVTDIYEDNQGNLIACGQELIPNWDTSSIVRHKWEGFVMKLDPAGNEIWKHHYYHPEASNPYASHFLYRIQPTPDGGYVAAGYLALPDTGTQDSWVIKVDSNGCLTPNCLVTGLPQIRRQNHLEVTVYPNPTSGTIHLELPQRMAMYRIVVLSLNGKQLHSQNTTYQKNVTLQLDQPPGVYFVQVWEKDQLIFEEKVIVR